MLTDLAGFAASTFKRGIGFINIPTTLLFPGRCFCRGQDRLQLSGTEERNWDLQNRWP